MSIPVKTQMCLPILCNSCTEHGEQLDVAEEFDKLVKSGKATGKAPEKVQEHLPFLLESCKDQLLRTPKETCTKTRRWRKPGDCLGKLPSLHFFCTLLTSYFEQQLRPQATSEENSRHERLFSSH